VNYHCVCKRINRMSEQDLIIAFNEREKQAFTIIYERLHPGIYYLAKRYVSADDAADITGDVFESLWRTTEIFEGIDNIKAWLTTCVRRGCLKRANREKKRIEIHKIASDQPQQENPDWLDEKERIERRIKYVRYIYSIVDDLPEERKNIFYMAFVDGLKSREIAAKLNLDPEKVRDVKRRILGTVKSSLVKKGVVLYSRFLSLFL
jgi:RNA polymerase sigma factor (sigma-70 family)